MSRIPKREALRHADALRLVAEAERRPLTLLEREQVLDDYHEGAQHMNGLAGAFFTPRGLARDLSIEVGNAGRVLDLCAGTGRLAAAIVSSRSWGGERIAPGTIVCVEQNPDYAAAGRAAVPEATWIVADALDLTTLLSLGHFDVAISNPPFGRVKTSPETGIGRRYRGARFEFKVIEAASRVASRGVFILPAETCPFRYSGPGPFRKVAGSEADRFAAETGFELAPNCGIDTTAYDEEWRVRAPATEIVCVDFEPDPEDLEQAVSGEPRSRQRRV